MHLTSVCNGKPNNLSKNFRKLLEPCPILPSASTHCPNTHCKQQTQAVAPCIPPLSRSPWRNTFLTSNWYRSQSRLAVNDIKTRTKEIVATRVSLMIVVGKYIQFPFYEGPNQYIDQDSRHSLPEKIMELVIKSRDWLLEIIAGLRQ